LFIAAASPICPETLVDGGLKVKPGEVAKPHIAEALSYRQITHLP